MHGSLLCALTIKVLDISLVIANQLWKNGGLSQHKNLIPVLSLQEPQSDDPVSSGAKSPRASPVDVPKAPNMNATASTASKPKDVSTDGSKHPTQSNAPPIEVQPTEDDASVLDGTQPGGGSVTQLPNDAPSYSDANAPPVGVQPSGAPAMDGNMQGGGSFSKQKTIYAEETVTSVVAFRRKGDNLVISMLVAFILQKSLL